VTRLRAGRPGFDSRQGAKSIFLRHRVQSGPEAYLAFDAMGTGYSFPRVKRPGREADHSPPPSAEVKNA